MESDLLAPIRAFLHCETPDAWITAALEHQDLLLIDHANCEKKAAATAMSLMYRYVERTELLLMVSRLAREELHHFEQVVGLLQAREIAYRSLSPSRYAQALMRHVRTAEPATLVDKLIIGALIEARSCERFARLAPHLDGELSRFYVSLLRSEARHYNDYLALAERYAGEPIGERIGELAAFEAELITSPDHEFRFHSGVPV